MKNLKLFNFILSINEKINVQINNFELSLFSIGFQPIEKRTHFKTYTFIFSSCLITLSIFLSCHNTKHPTKEKETLVSTIDSLAASIPEELAYYVYKDYQEFQKDIANRKIEILQTDTTDALVYRDSIGHLRMGIRHKNTLKTWQISHSNEAGNINELAIQRINLDNEAPKEVVLTYEVIEYYSSMGSANSKSTEIWKINPPTLYFEIGNYYSEASGRNSEEDFFKECELAIEILPLKINITKVKDTGNCRLEASIGRYCLNGNEVLKCE